MRQRVGNRRRSREAKVFGTLRADVSDATRERKRKTRRHVKWLVGINGPKPGYSTSSLMDATCKGWLYSISLARLASGNRAAHRCIRSYPLRKPRTEYTMYCSTVVAQASELHSSGVSTVTAMGCTAFSCSVSSFTNRALPHLFCFR